MRRPRPRNARRCVSEPDSENLLTGVPFDHASEYRNRGWTGTIPLPPGAKFPPPGGCTGRGPSMPTTDQIRVWRARGWNATDRDTGHLVDHQVGNIALRLPPIIVGIDVDAYPPKQGARTLAALRARWGELPPTYITTSRRDGVSGIRLYRVPAGLMWPGKAGSDIEIVHHGIRYAIVWPSVHPDTGDTYRWLGPDGQPCGIPEFGDIPSLPDAWVTGLTGSTGAGDKNGRSHTNSSTPSGVQVSVQNVRDWLAKLPAREPCTLVRLRAAKALAAARGEAGSRHDSTRDAVLALLRAGESRHPGVLAALTFIRAEFVENVGKDRDSAGSEFDSFTEGGVKLILAEPADLPVKGCDCAERRDVPFPDEPAGQPPDDDRAVGRRVVLTPASAIKPRRVRWLWKGRLALGTLGLLAGGEGLGKSTLAYTIAAEITRGALPGEYQGTPRAVLVCAAEDSWEHTIVPRLMAAGADLDRVFRVEIKAADDITVGLSLPQDTARVEAAAEQVEAALMILDPLMSRLDGALDSYKDADVRRALEPLVALADRVRMAVLGLMHHNKSGSSDPLQLVMASKAFTAVARSVHTVIKDPDDETEQRRLFGTPKNNLGRTDLSTLSFTIVGHAIDTEEGPANTGRLVWGEAVEGTIADALRRSVAAEAEGMTTAVGKATEWLLAHLRGRAGVDESHAIMAAGKAAGHSESAIKRARKKAQVDSTSTDTFPRRTYWSLPLDAQSIQGSGHSPRGDDLTELTEPTVLQSVQSVQSAQGHRREPTIDPTGHGTSPVWPTQRAS
ncbi:AAA family ATPase [Spongiactinospora sp. 9N601]|uniref:AAA family ATPase n=1 Tax=Spongiactinospora sp. 9N601 TaxID=3375149 RepID=UPI0037B6946F